MKKILFLAVACTAVNVVSAPLPIEHVLVSVPLHKKSAETALPVTVFSGDQLRRAAGGTLGETLSRTPGLANASFGPGVGQPVIRGQQGARVTVLQNGTSSADASNLSADHANAVEPMLAQSIEILRGPATLLYGGGAIGGVVNIIDNRIPTNVPDATEGGIEYRVDSASNMQVGVLSLDTGGGNFALHIDGLVRDWRDVEIPGSATRELESDHDEDAAIGRITNTDGEIQSGTLGGSYHFSEGFAGLSVSRMINEYGIPSGAHDHHEDEEAHEPEELENLEEEGDIRLDVEQTRYDAALHWHEPMAWLEVLRGFVTYTDYEHVEIEPSGEVGTQFENDTWEGRLELVHQPIGAFHGVLGMQARHTRFSALGEEAFVPKTRSEELGLFLLEDFHSGSWTYEGGVRLDWIARDPNSSAASKQDFFALSISGSFVLELNSDWQVGVALSRAERAPATEELYSNIEAAAPDQWVVHAATNAVELGSEDLGKETSKNVDLSLLWSRGGHFIDVKIFYNDFADYISLRNTGSVVDEVPVFNYEQLDSEFYGIELESSFILGEVANAQLTLGVFADAIEARQSGGAEIPRLPPARVGLRAGWEGRQWKLWSNWLRAGAQDEPGTNEAPSKSYQRWDLGGEYSFDIGDGDLLFSLEAKNLTDEEIRLSTSFLREVAPEAGRSLVGYMRYTF